MLSALRYINSIVCDDFENKIVCPSKEAVNHFMKGFPRCSKDCEYNLDAWQNRVIANVIEKQIIPTIPTTFWGYDNFYFETVGEHRFCGKCRNRYKT